jgi:proline iminopeptidase
MATRKNVFCSTERDKRFQRKKDTYNLMRNELGGLRHQAHLWMCRGKTILGGQGFAARSLLYLISLLLLAGAIAATNCRAPENEGQKNLAKVEEGYFTGADGIRLFYRKVGQGAETAVYLHGGPWNMSDGGYELDELAEKRTLIAFDQRSGGRSELVNDPERLTAEYYVRDLEALRQHFGLEKMTLIGHSWGCGLAMLYIAEHPQRVNRLLLMSPLPPAADPFWSQRLEKTNAVIGVDGVARMEELSREIISAPDDKVAALCRELMQIMFRGYLTDVSAMNRMKVGYCEYSPAAIRHQLKAGDIAFASLGNWDFRPTLAKLKISVLVVEGADTHVPLEATREWIKACPTARLLLVPGANHITWLEGDIPKLFRDLKGFLNGQWPDAAKTVK